MQTRRLATRRMRPCARQHGRRRQQRRPRRLSPRGAARAWLGPPIFPAWPWWPLSVRPRRLSKPPNGTLSPAARRPSARQLWTKMLRRLWRLPSALRRRLRSLRQPHSAIKKGSLRSAGGVRRVRLPRPRRRAKRRQPSRQKKRVKRAKRAARSGGGVEVAPAPGVATTTDGVAVAGRDMDRQLIDSGCTHTMLSSQVGAQWNCLGSQTMEARDAQGRTITGRGGPLFARLWNVYG